MQHHNKPLTYTGHKIPSYAERIMRSICFYDSFIALHKFANFSA